MRFSLLVLHCYCWGQVMGLNAIFAFVGSGFVVRILIKNHIGTGTEATTTYTWIYTHLFKPWAGALNGSLLFAIATGCFWWLILYFMYRHSWYLKISSAHQSLRQKKSIKNSTHSWVGVFGHGAWRRSCFLPNAPSGALSNLDHPLKGIEFPAAFNEEIGGSVVELLVSPQYFRVDNYSGFHDQPKGLREDLSQIIVAREGILPVSEIRSRTYSKKLIPNFRVVATRDIKVSQALVPSVV
ncbi:hypothetical protein [Nostoc sp.]|uniref:hypothetical protein n=1 Tax=Nostoc sp. TaxID=1180 RepID=UPI002FF70DEF